MNFDSLNIEEPKDNSAHNMQAIWLTSLADLISLVLTFFILMYSTRDVPQEKFEQIQTSFVEYMKGDVQEKYNFIYKKGATKVIRKSQGSNYVEGLVRNQFSGKENLRVSVSSRGNDTVIEFIDDQSSIESFGGDFKERILQLSKILNTLSNQVEVKVTGTNPELSLHLADMVSDKIKESGYEYDVLQTVNDESIETLEKNKNNLKIQILVKGYEFAF